jgi:hypothetical protein
MADEGLAKSIPHRLQLMNGNKLQEWLTTLAKQVN